MPIPGLEAMASGCLFVTTDSGGVREYAKHNYNSIIVSDPKDIWRKNVIEKTLENQNKTKKIILNGYKTVSSFWEDDIIKDLKKIIFKNDKREKI